MLAPDSVANVRAVLAADAHAFPVWCVRALHLLLDELEVQREGHLGPTAAAEIATTQRRLDLAKQLLVEWSRELETTPEVPEGSDAHWYKLGHVRAVQSCMLDLRTVLNGGI